jgi:radical SAM protein with 4Fe4S-binding SPASM domain
VSLDGLKEANDSFRGMTGAFDKTMAGIEALMDAGVKVGLRFTISRRNAAEIPGIFDLMLERRIPRICFYHLVYSGRGTEIMADSLSAEETRRTVDMIIDRTVGLFDAGHKAEVLTVDNHTDGVYLYLRLLREDPEKAARVLELLRMNGGNSTGLGIASIGWDGSVHPDQFWREHVVGNVRERPFSKIWGEPTDKLLINLRRRKELLHGRCAECAYLELCNGNFRARAEAVHNDQWAPDPACYLTDEEIGIVEAAGVT